MNKKSQQILAFILIALGGLYLAANFINIDPSDIFWPLAMIMIGLFFIFRPKGITAENAQFFFAGDKDYAANWQVQDENLNMFAGDIFIDLGKADLPAGRTTIGVRCFASDIDINLPEDVGLRVSSTGFVVETKIKGENTSHVMTGFNYKSPNYDSAEKKFDLITQSFAIELSVREV
ncbi:MAG: cell wall-active antibiotics response protein LiaF [Chloroflexota bacterium]